MPISMYNASVPVFVQFLTALGSLLDKMDAHIESKKLDPAYFINMRMYPDMFPFVRQVRAATDHAVTTCSRLAGVEPVVFTGNETNVADLKQRVAKAVEFIRSIRPEQIDGTEDKEIIFQFPGGDRKFTGQSLLLGFCLPNFYFHATTAYNLLRKNGVDIGKSDFMGVPPQM